MGDHVLVDIGGLMASRAESGKEEAASLIGMVEYRLCQEEDLTKCLESPCACSGSLKMERTVEINDNLHPNDLEMLGTAPVEHIMTSVDETSPEHSQDGMPSFLPGSGNLLEQLGLFMKADEEEEEEEEKPSSVPSIKDAEEGEVN